MTGTKSMMVIALITASVGASEATAQPAASATRWASGAPLAAVTNPTSPEAHLESAVACSDTSFGAGGDDLTGSWVCDVTGSLGDQFKALLTYTPGGGLIESESAPLQSAGHGTWARITAGHYKFTFLQLLSSDVDGTFVGIAKISSTHLRLDGDKLSDSKATLEIFDSDGTEVFSGTARASCTRILAGS